MPLTYRCARIPAEQDRANVRTRRLDRVCRLPLRRASPSRAPAPTEHPRESRDLHGRRRQAARRRTDPRRPSRLRGVSPSARQALRVRKGPRRLGRTLRQDKRAQSVHRTVRTCSGDHPTPQPSRRLAQESTCRTLDRQLRSSRKSHQRPQEFPTARAS